MADHDVLGKQVALFLGVHIPDDQQIAACTQSEGQLTNFELSSASETSIVL